MYIPEDEYSAISAAMSDTFFLVSLSKWERPTGKDDGDGNWSTLDGQRLEPSTECYEPLPLNTPLLVLVFVLHVFGSLSMFGREILPQRRGTGSLVLMKVRI
ncbi:hypothetical protein NXS19_013588 [Fusarium pseudograminearum]|nr:hypothetical protein NXS19_013588 [Fusarium pseudograminearum]